MTRLDLDKLPADARARVERALSPRTAQVGIRAPQASVEAWRRAAKVARVTLTAWVQGILDRAAGLRREER